MINILDPSARLNDNVPAKYRGLERFARASVVLAELGAAGLIERIDQHTPLVPRGDRSGVVLEPLLTDQWYVQASRRWPARPSRRWKTGRIRFVPENWSQDLLRMDAQHQDWCISRQLWWGHRIPAWYDAAGNVYVGRSEADAVPPHATISQPTSR